MSDDLPYSGLKVFDATQGVAGPHCALLLAQHGADVIKVEPPGGDWNRALGTQFGDLSAYAMIYNRGKRSIALDLKHPEGNAIAKRLAVGADVVLEAYRPGVMQRLGLDYDAVRADNPEVIYLSVTGYGQKGPYTGHPVTDSIMQGFSGLMSINRDSQGTPQRIGMIAIDVFTGLYAFQAVSAALYKRAVKGGGGAYIDASLMQAATAFQSAKIAEHHLVGAEQPALGAPVGTVQTSDGYINLNARRPAHFEALCRLIGRPELIDDPRFESPRARIDNEDALMPIVRAALRDWPTAKLTAALHENDILNAPINTYSEIFEDPQVEAMNAIEWVEHQGMGRVPMPNVPGIAPPRAGHPLAESPHVGQHSREILAELGHSEAEIAALAESGAVVIRDAEEALA